MALLRFTTWHKDIANQVPLFDCGLILLDVGEEREKYDTEAEIAADSAKESSVRRSDGPLRRSNIDSSNFYPRTRRRGPDRLGKAFQALDKKFTEYSHKVTQEEAREPLFDSTIRHVTPSVPLTWAMLTQREIDKTKNPTLEEPVRKSSPTKGNKTKQVRIAGHRASDPESPPKPSLAEVFKQKEQEEILTEAAAAARGYFSSSRSASVASIHPANLGRDDTSKSAQDLTEEFTNRNVWEKFRSVSTLDMTSGQEQPHKPGTMTP